MGRIPALWSITRAGGHSRSWQGWKEGAVWGVGAWAAKASFSPCLFPHLLLFFLPFFSTQISLIWKNKQTHYRLITLWNSTCLRCALNKKPQPCPTLSPHYYPSKAITPTGSSCVFSGIFFYGGLFTHMFYDLWLQAHLWRGQICGNPGFVIEGMTDTLQGGLAFAFSDLPWYRHPWSQLGGSFPCRQHKFKLQIDVIVGPRL